MLDLGCLPLALIQDESTVPTALKTADIWVGLIQRALTAIAILVGGFIAVVKFRLLNPLRLHLEPEISGSFARRAGTIYLQGQASAKNTELRTVRIDPDYTGLRVSVFRSETNQWELYETYGVFEEQFEVEANTTIGEPVWIMIPEGDFLALRLELWIASGPEQGWIAIAIVNLVTEEDNKERNQSPVEQGPSRGLRERMARWLGSRV
jgi:hypothetical protein